LKQILSNGNAKEVLKQLEEEGILKRMSMLDKFLDSEDFIRLNYFRFHPDLAYEINKYYIKKNPKLYKLNKQLHDLIKNVVNEANKSGIDVAYREIL
jgi:hypothetical protein